MKSMTHTALASTTATLLLLAAPLPGQGQEQKIPDDKDPKTTESGLKYSILKAGEGPSPKLGDKVVVNYTGWLTNGTMFDSSRQGPASQPAEFAVGMVIPGWNEALMLMSKGARFKLTIPPSLGYGEQGVPPRIPANSTLVFDVELVSFNAGRAPTPDFVKPDAAAQKATDSGLKYEVLRAGEGDTVKADQAIAFEMAYWDTTGKLMFSSTFQDFPMYGKASTFRLGVLREGLAMMKAGARYRFEAPPALGFGEQARPDLPANSVTIWTIDLLEVIKTPDFVLPKAEDLKKTESGLQYQVIAKGKGKSPAMGDPVIVQYAGWLTDGTLFDASFNRGQPASFRIGQLINGWNEGLQMMKPGAIYRFVIPSNLGYGERGSPPTIPANATLVFYVQLLK